MTQQELYEFYDGQQTRENEAKAIRKEIKEGMEAYATNNECCPKALAEGYKLWKKIQKNRQNAATEEFEKDKIAELLLQEAQ
jgi:hypothetical protein